MSIEGLTAFFARLQEDPELQERAHAVSGPADEKLAALCALAAEAGLTVTPGDLRSAQADPATAALEDETLGKVVGGGCSAVGIVSPGFGDSLSPMG